MDIPLRRLEAGYCVLAIVLGFLYLCADPHRLIFPDSMSYLDIAEALRRGDWQAAVNAYWSPLYSWLIALALFIASPSPYWKFALVHLVTFVMYLMALGCFAFFIRELSRAHRTQARDALSAGLAMLPDWGLIGLGYSLFLWSAFYLIGPTESPDMLVAGLVFVIAGTLLRIRRQPAAWSSFVVLGTALGFGYLAKTFMLPMSAVFLAVSLFQVGDIRRALPRVAVAGTICLLIAGPFIVAISQAKGRPTFGESGRLNYLWSINDVSEFHWQGQQPGHGRPLHPTRQIFDAPPIYEFGAPIGGTYPLWYDPTYWYEGSVSRFDLRQQLRVFVLTAHEYYEIFQRQGVQYGLLVGLLSLLLLRRPPRLLLDDLRSCWSLLVPAVIGMALYSVIWVEGRYVAPFLILLWLSLFAGIRVPNGQGRKWIHNVALVLVALTTFTVVTSAGAEAGRTLRSLVQPLSASEHEYWEVADGLRVMGVPAGDRIAVIGSGLRAYWANLAGLQIVAELPETSAFWNADPPLKDGIVQAFATTGAAAIVTGTPPAGQGAGWRQIGNTGYFLYMLPSRPQTVSD